MRGRSNSEMGLRQRTLILGFIVALFFGMAVYFRLWSFDSSFTVDDREELRFVSIIKLRFASLISAVEGAGFWNGAVLLLYSPWSPSLDFTITSEIPELLLGSEFGFGKGLPRRSLVQSLLSWNYLCSLFLYRTCFL
ncbi:hypothetical protein KSP40_PGU012618 [Platanthera guangdongensis]|uniref:Uncharacterized protein n=1 Tax=Platanthera guangdongensis TaxID=2320717 RepID=A0ABR2LU14_9ASPA